MPSARGRLYDLTSVGLGSLPMQFSFTRRVSVLLGATIAASVLGIQVQLGSAQATEEKWTVTTVSSDKNHAGKSYFIEFRGRSAANYGHMYVLYGRVNARDEIVSSRIAGSAG